MKKGAQNAYLQVVEGNDNAGIIQITWIPAALYFTGSAYSRMKTEISHLRNKKKLSVKAFSFSAFNRLVLNFYRF